MKTENVHIYHIKATLGDKEICCHYTGTKKDVWQYASVHIALGYTVEIYQEV